MSKRKATIELVENSGAAALYSLKFESSATTEFEDFMAKFKDSTIKEIYKDFQDIISRIRHITINGAHERYFRRESKAHDGVGALPIFTDRRKSGIGVLRLYCLRISDNLLIIGNGDIKTTRTYNKDPLLNKYVEDLATIDRIIKLHKEKGSITITDNIISPESFIFYM